MAEINKIPGIKSIAANDRTLKIFFFISFLFYVMLNKRRAGIALQNTRLLFKNVCVNQNIKLE
jgi:hypothetical protein